MSQDMDQLIERLNANQNAATQAAAITQLLAMQDRLDLKKFCQHGPKALWENEALVLQKIGFPRLNAMIPDLLLWLQDLNWPGARTVLRLLQTAPADLFKAAAQSAIRMAQETEDEEWMRNLRWAEGIQRQDPEALKRLGD